MGASKKVTLNQKFITDIVPPSEGRDYYYDEKEDKLCLQVTPKGAKTFYVLMRINHKVQRIKIGVFPTVKIERAREMCRVIKARVLTGENPNEQRQQNRRGITFKELYDMYMEKHANLFRRSAYNDKCLIEKHCSCFFSRKINSITHVEIKDYFDKLGRKSHNTANSVLERIRAMYNKAIEWEVFKGTNPALNIRPFAKVKRDRFLMPDEVKDFFTVLSTESRTLRDIVYLGIYTGARKGNILSMEWSEINFQTKMWRIPAEKSKNGQVIVIPLVDEAMSVLNRRKVQIGGKFVFPSESKSGHLTDFKKSWTSFRKKWMSFKQEKYNLPQAPAVSDFRFHDLRRTIASYQALNGSSLLIIGKSLGHASTDATEIYARLMVEPVKKSMESAVSMIQKQRTSNLEVLE